MKKIIFIILIGIFLTSCFEIHDSSPKITTGYLINKEYKPRHSEYCYHYGYNMMSGKFNWHWGMDDKPESYNVTLRFLTDTNTYQSSNLYQNITDTFTVVYTESYLCKKNDSTFRGYQIKNIVLKDTIIDF